MADKEITWESKGADQVARDTRDVAKAQDQAEASTRKAGKAAGDATDQWASVAKAAVLAQVAYVALNKTLTESVEVYADVNAEQGRIARNLRQIGVEGPAADRAMSELNQRFRDNTQFGAKISEQTVVFRELLDVTKDRAAAESDLALAIDINADKNNGLDAATKAVTKARLGDVAALAELGVLSRDQAATLGAITNESQRSAIAMSILQDEFRGAAQENLGLADQLAANDAQLERLQIALGKVVSEFGAEGVGFIGATLDAVSASESGTFTIDNLAASFENFADQVPTATENIGRFLDELELRDLPGLAANLGALTEEGRAGIRGIAARGAPSAGANFIAAARARAQDQRAKDNAPIGPVGPELDPETRIRIAKEQQDAELAAQKAALDAIRDRDKAEAEAEVNRQKRWEAQMARLQQDRDEQEKAAEDAQKKAEDDAKAEAKAIATRRTEVERWSKDQAKFSANQRRNEELVAKSREEAAQTSIAAVSQVGNAALEGAGIFLQGENAKLVKKGLGEASAAAEAVATGVTTGNPLQFVGAGLHTAAAVQYFASAARSTGVAPKGGGAGGGAPAPPSIPASTRRDADLVGERGPAQSATPSTIHVYQSLWPPTGQQVRDTRRILEQDAGRTV